MSKDFPKKKKKCLKSEAQTHFISQERTKECHVRIIKTF